MTTVIAIEVADDNRFNMGWLSYLTGLPRPDEDEDPQAAMGWDTGAETVTLRPVRLVFDPDNTNFVVNLRAPKPPAPREVIAKE